MINSDFWDNLKEVYVHEDGGTDNFETEKPLLKQILELLSKELNDKYEFLSPLGKGGSGIVIKVQDKNMSIPRALKLPRPMKDSIVDTVKNEMWFLNTLRHENIISVHHLGVLEVPDYQNEYPYFIMDFIDGAQDLKNQVELLCNSIKSGNDIKRITEWLLLKLSVIAKAISFLHANSIVHFDIKPTNILIDPSSKPFLSDMGFSKLKSDSAEAVVVGFTMYYAHPKLSREYGYMTSLNRVRKPLAPKDFCFEWDIYAFGKTILELLGYINSCFNGADAFDYTFSYLHLMACRMLDGRNIGETELNHLREELVKKGIKRFPYAETWLNLNASELSEIKYKGFSQILEDFGKIINKDSFLASVPELTDSFPNRVHCSDGPSAPFSKRVKYIIEHPVFMRLKYIPQLGLTDTIYPSASHSRYEHSIGVFRNCCLYLKSLYLDPFNPLFRQLVSKFDINLLLIASLIHDLGQFPLAHEIEEVTKEFRHEDFTIRFLDNPSKNKDGLTLKDIIEDEDWGWGVKLDLLQSYFKKPDGQQLALFASLLKDQLLYSILSGPIDADKLDYLLRDSSKCHLKYADSIDIDRLVENLTVVLTVTPNQKRIMCLGSYEKGQSAAESLAFSRYLLYQTVYWHHTSRAVRAMIGTIFKEIISDERSSKKKGNKPTFKESLERTLGTTNLPQSVTVSMILNLIRKHTNKNTSELVNMIINRYFYKRLITIHYDPSIGGDEPLISKLRVAVSKVGFAKKLQENILNAYSRYVSAVQAPRTSLLSETITNRTIERLELPYAILCDAPNPSYGIEDKLQFIPEPKRLLKNYSNRLDFGSRVSEVYNTVYYHLMNISAKGRIFCYPTIRDPLLAVLGPQIIKEWVEKTINEF